MTPTQKNFKKQIEKLEKKGRIPDSYKPMWNRVLGDNEAPPQSQKERKGCLNGCATMFAALGAVLAAICLLIVLAFFVFPYLIKAIGTAIGFVMGFSYANPEVAMVIVTILAIILIHVIYSSMNKNKEQPAANDDTPKPLSIVLEKSTYEKLVRISISQRRPLKNQAEFIIQEYIKGYENENGAIQLINRAKEKYI